MRRLVACSVVLERGAQLHAEASDELQRVIREDGEHYEAFRSWLQRIHALQVEQLDAFLHGRLQRIVAQASREAAAPSADGVTAAVGVTSSAGADAGLVTPKRGASSSSSSSFPMAASHQRRQRRRWRRNQALVRCFRAFSALGLAERAEHAVVQHLLKPFLRRNFTKGRVDVGGARGACAGLAGLLEAYVLIVCLAV